MVFAGRCWFELLYLVTLLLLTCSCCCVCNADGVGSASLQRHNCSDVNGQTEHGAVPSFNHVDVLRLSNSRDADSHISQALMSSGRYSADANVDADRSCGTRLSSILSDSDDDLPVTSHVKQHSSLMHCSPTNTTPPQLPSVDRLQQCHSFRVCQKL